MSTEKPVRVLLVPDLIWGDNSGAESARFTASLLDTLGYNVGVYAYLDKNNRSDTHEGFSFSYFPRIQSSGVHHFFGGAVKSEFQQVLENFDPDYVFFVGAALSKPYPFYKVCIDKNISFNLLYYINDYYCMRVYAGLKDGPCFRCIGGNYLPAYTNHCQSKQSRLVQFLKSALVLRRIKKVFKKCHKVVGYSDDQLSLYRRYGFTDEQCVKSPIQFNNDCIQDIESSRGDYFVLCGQSSIEKGWHYMAAVVESCPDVRFRFVFPSKATAKKQSAVFGLQELVNSGQIEIVTGLQKHDDLMTLLAGARGVLIPSNYPTTGEFIMMESLGLGKPVIVFDAGIHPDIIRSGENGLMAKVGDVQEFARHINNLNLDDQLYDTLSHGARLLFAELNSFEKLADAVRLALPPRNAPPESGL